MTRQIFCFKSITIRPKLVAFQSKGTAKILFLLEIRGATNLLISKPVAGLISLKKFRMSFACASKLQYRFVNIRVRITSFMLAF
jgi:hypothetical protein